MRSCRFIAALICIGCVRGLCYDVVRLVGDNIRLPCTSTLTEKVNWVFTKPGTKNQIDMFRLAMITEGWEERFALQMTNSGGYTLFIANSTSDDTGVYTCIEDGGVGEVVACHNLTITVISDVKSGDRCEQSSWSALFVTAILMFLLAASFLVFAVFLLCRIRASKKRERTQRATIELL